ncbi:P-loop containing nucleoside triphosphate hydrolase protein [Aspergillus undulatus]|uniref:P-loop containing nucleoside triphosphate hydrolase protein n=1 Tax=Aspergillus undulatus TaxID=1810928 RepID=UPI003CCDCB81
MNPAEHDEVVSQFCAMTRARPDEAQGYLATNGWDLEAAVTEFFAEQDETAGSAEPAGRPVAKSSSSTPRESSSSRRQPSKKFATLGDLTTGAGDSSDDDDDVNQDFFAGGEKSGLAVQNPDDLKKKIIEKARRTQLPASDDNEPRRDNFTGSARTLGGEDTPSRVIEAPSAPAQPQVPRRVRRTLHFWVDGFSVDDGDLYRSDDPQNSEILNSIRQGRAPLSIMNAQHGQDVDVEIKQHDENYVRPKPKYKPFAGQGQRLGSPTPGVRTSVASEPTPAPQSSPEPPKTNVDESQPAVTLQVRLGDGTRLTSRFNTTHTIGDVYDFVSAASPQSQSRSWVLLTTFPSKELTDKAAVLGDLAEFKRGGVVILSGKGGVGKSSVTLQLALALSLQGKSVGILDIDLTGPSIPRLVGLEGAKITQSPNGWIPVPVHDSRSQLPSSSSDATAAANGTQTENESPSSEQGERRGSLHCMSLGFLLRDRGDAVIWRGPKKTAMIRQFLTDVYWGETDYLLVDTPPGTSDEHIALAEELLKLAMTDQASTSTGPQSLPRLTGAVLVTTPQAIATSDVRKEVNFCVKTNIPALGVIENMSGYTCPCCGEVSNLFSSGGGEVMAREMGVRFLGKVPVDVQFGALVEGRNRHDEGSEDDEDEKVEEALDERPLVERYRECWSYGRFEGVAKTLIGEIEG